jgi:MYXO-CTERM domain-containing protein
LKEIPVKKIVLSALALAAAAGAANAQSIEFRWTERHGQTLIPVGAVPAASNNFNGAGAATDATVWLVLEARLNTAGNTSLRGIGGGAGSITTNDTLGFGAFRTSNVGVPAVARNASAASATSVPGWASIRFHSSDPETSEYAIGTSPNGSGIFQPWRFVADLPPGNVTGSINGNSSIDMIAWAAAGREVQALDLGPGGEAALNTPAQFGRDSWAPIYTLQYNFTNLTPREVTFGGTFAAFTAFSSYDASGVPNSVQVQNLPVPGYTVTVAPAPGAAALLGLGGLVAARRRRA